MQVIQMLHPRTLLAGAVCVAALLAGCSSMGPTTCRPGEQPAVSELLYFGTGIPSGGAVSGEDWAAFVDSSVTPRFPAGLTVWPAAGQWQSANGSISRESSYVVNLLYPLDADAGPKVEALVAEYKTKFRQEAVLRVRGHACMSL
jgi:hypothetical protein